MDQLSFVRNVRVPDVAVQFTLSVVVLSDDEDHLTADGLIITCDWVPVRHHLGVVRDQH
jgi:hypothetical protein